MFHRKLSDQVPTCKLSSSHHLLHHAQTSILSAQMKKLRFPQISAGSESFFTSIPVFYDPWSISFLFLDT